MSPTIHLYLSHPRPLPTAPRHHRRPPMRPLLIPLPPLPLLLIIKHQLQHIVRELRKLQTHSTELGLRLMPQAERARRPERRNRPPDGRILGVGFLVHIARVCKLALCGGRRAVDLAVSEGFEVGEFEAVGERVDAGVDEEAEAVVVGGGLAGVLFERGVARGRGLFGEVFACVEVFDCGAHGVGVDVGHDDLAGLESDSVMGWGCERGGTYTSCCELLDVPGEFGRFDEDGFVGRVGGLGGVGSDYDFNDGALHQAELLSASSSFLLVSFVYSSLQGSFQVHKAVEVACPKAARNDRRMTL